MICFLQFFGYDVFTFGPFLAPYGSLLASFRSQIDSINFIRTDPRQFSTKSNRFMTFSIFRPEPPAIFFLAPRYLLLTLSIQSGGLEMTRITLIFCFPICWYSWRLAHLRMLRSSVRPSLVPGLARPILFQLWLHQNQTCSGIYFRILYGRVILSQ